MPFWTDLSEFKVTVSKIMILLEDYDVIIYNLLIIILFIGLNK